MNAFLNIFLLRRFFALAVVLPLATVLFSGCGGNEEFAANNSATNSAGNTATAPADNAATPGDMNAQVEPPSQPGKYGGTLINSSISVPRSLNPWISKETSTGAVVGPLYEGLITRNSYTLKHEGRLAELPQVSADGLTYTFQLKPELKWSDEQPVTAGDVVFTLDVIFDPKVDSSLRESMMVDVPVTGSKPQRYKREPIKYRRVDERTVEFKFPVPYAPALDMLSFNIAPRHKLEAAYKSGKFNQTWGVNANVKELVSSGAWIIESYVPGQRVVYKRNPNYWQKDAEGRALPYLDRYVLLFVPDLNTQTIKFQNGDIDILGVQHMDYPLIKRGEQKGNYKVLNLGPSWGFNYIGFNLNPNSRTAKRKPEMVELFRKLEFRQAISHAINRARLSESVFKTLATPSYSSESPANTLFHNPDVPQFPYDPAKAKELLQQAGLRSAPGQKHLQYKGKDVPFIIVTNTENNTRKLMATIIAEDLRKIGLNATFTPIAFNKLVSKLNDAPYDWEAHILGFTGGPEPHTGRDIWQSSGTLHTWWPRQKTPATPWEAEIDEIFRKGAQTLDVAERKKLYGRWQQILGEQQPMTFTVVPNTITAVRNKFGNLKPNALGGALWNLEELYDLKAARDTP